jgi:hypothetical protein
LKMDFRVSVCAYRIQIPTRSFRLNWSQRLANDPALNRLAL